MIAHRPFLVRARCLAAWAAILTVATPVAWADLSVLAVTGDAAPGGGGELLQGVFPGAINDGGQVVFRSTLQEGIGGVTSSNNEALWRVGVSSELLARKGNAAPGGGSFASLQQAAIDDAGSVALRATLQSAQSGIWRLSSPGSGEVVARTQDFEVPGVANGRFQSFDFGLLQSSSDVFAYGAMMVGGAGGVSTANNKGVWIDDGSSASLLARKDLTSPPGVPAGKFETFSVTAVNNAGQATLRATMSTGFGGVVNLTRTGVWRLAVEGGSLVARQGVSSVPGVAGEWFQQFEDPVINASGQVAFDATLAGGARGVWRYDGSTGALIVRTGEAAPGATGAQFSDVAAPLLNDAGQTLFKGTLAAGIGGVGAGNNLGLWLAEPGNGSLLARTGSGGVPDIADANFTAFGNIALNSHGIAAVSAELELGPGGVSTGNEHGIWLLDAAGGSRLIARTGEQLAGRTIASLELLGGSGGGDGRARSLNDAGQLVFKAAFTDGAEATVLYSSQSFDSPANFDGDDDVDGEDLSIWAANFGAGPGAANGQGDANLDGYVDGADFLLWQREVTGAPSVSDASVPEPASGLVALSVVLAIAVRRKRARCLNAVAALFWK